MNKVTELEREMRQLVNLKDRKASAEFYKMKRMKEWGTEIRYLSKKQN